MGNSNIGKDYDHLRKDQPLNQSHLNMFTKNP